MVHPHLSIDHVKQLEIQVIAICNHCTTLSELAAAASPLWDWTSQALDIPIDKLRGEIEAHETDEQFETAYLEEKDHLLKLPLVLLEHLNQNK